MKKCLKKKENAELHADFKSIEKVVKMNTKKVISKTNLMIMSKSSLLRMFMKFVRLITFFAFIFLKLFQWIPHMPNLRSHLQVMSPTWRLRTIQYVKGSCLILEPSSSLKAASATLLPLLRRRKISL